MEYNFKLCVICTGDSGAAENLTYSLITRSGVRLVIFESVRRYLEGKIGFAIRHQPALFIR